MLNYFSPSKKKKRLNEVIFFSLCHVSDSYTFSLVGRGAKKYHSIHFLSHHQSTQMPGPITVLTEQSLTQDLRLFCVLW